MSIEERLGRIEEHLEHIETLLSLSVSQVMNVKQVALLLGRSESRIRHLVANREIPHYKNSRGQISFILSEIEDWRKGEKVATVDDIDSEAATRIAINRLNR